MMAAAFSVRTFGGTVGWGMVSYARSGPVGLLRKKKK
jgi:hypothetical protein